MILLFNTEFSNFQISFKVRLDLGKHSCMYGCDRSVSAGAPVFVPAIAEEKGEEGEEEAAELDVTIVVPFLRKYIE